MQREEDLHKFSTFILYTDGEREKAEEQRAREETIDEKH